MQVHYCSIVNNNAAAGLSRGTTCGAGLNTEEERPPVDIVDTSRSSRSCEDNTIYTVYKIEET